MEGKIMIDHKIRVGLSTVYEREGRATAAEITADSVGVLDYLVSTPTLLAMIMDASSKILNPLLPEGYITVGKKIELLHENPTLTDEIIKVKLIVTEVNENRIYMDFTANDAFGQICKGKYVKVIIEQQELLINAYNRAEKTL